MWLDKRWADAANVARKEAKLAMLELRLNSVELGYQIPDWLEKLCVKALQGDEEEVFHPVDLKVRVEVSDKDVEMGVREQAILKKVKNGHNNKRT